MQRDGLEGWMVKQMENAELQVQNNLKFTVAAPRRPNGDVAVSRRSICAVVGQEMNSLLPAQSPRPVTNHRDDILQRVEDPEEKKWRAQFHDRRQVCVEGGHIDRTKVLHNIKEKQPPRDEKSPLILWGLPSDHMLDFIRQSVLPASWGKPVSRPVGERKAVSDEEDEAVQFRRALSNALASAPKKHSTPRAPSPPRSPSQVNAKHPNPRRSGMSPRVKISIATPSSPRTPRQTPRAEDRIVKFIAELRADPELWAAFQVCSHATRPTNDMILTLSKTYNLPQRDIEQIQHQYQLRNDISDKIRENKQRARTPRPSEIHEQRKKEAEERMERTRRQREQLIQLEDERLKVKREAYLRRVNPTRELSTAELELTVRYRRRKVWLQVVSFAAISNRWYQQLVQTKHLIMMAKAKRKAASTIQRIWRKWKWKHASEHNATVYTWLRKCLWKLLMRARCRRKTQHAVLLQQFIINHFSESHATRNFNRMMHQWRSKVIQAQKAGRAFIHCSRARMQALSMWWDTVDHERQRMDRQMNSSNEDGRRLTGRKDSIQSNIGSVISTGAPGSAGKQRSRAGSILPSGMDEKLANMQMLLTPIEIQRLQQSAAQVVKIPKSTKMRLLTEFLSESRKEFRKKQQAYREMMLCASYAREVKLEEARAIVQSSVNWDTTRLPRTGSISRIAPPPPCFTLFSDPNGEKVMETLVRRGVQLTLDADPELRALTTRQQEHRVQSPHQSRRTSVSFSPTAALSFASVSTLPSLSPSPRTSILKRPTLGNVMLTPTESPNTATLPTLTQPALSGRATTPTTSVSRR